MNGLEIYVKSSALGNTGIHWRNISKAGQPREDPEILTRRIVPKKDGSKGTIEYLIDDTKPFFVLAAYENQIFLEVTGIKASQGRSKRLKREVFDIIAWVADRDTANEQIIKSLAVRTLFSFWERNLDFFRDISSAIEFDGLEAFQVEVEKINKLISTSKETLAQFLEESKRGSIYDQSKTVWHYDREINSDEEANSLAYQILQSPLSEDTFPLVVVVDARNDRNFHFKSVVCENKSVPESTEDVKHTPINNTEAHKKKAYPGLINLGVFTAGIMIGLLMGLLIAIVFLGAKLPTKSQPTSSLPQSIQPSVIDKAQLNQSPPCLQIPPCETSYIKSR